MRRKWLLPCAVAIGVLLVTGCGGPGTAKKPKLDQFKAAYNSVTVGMDEIEMVRTIGMSAIPAGYTPNESKYELQQDDGRIFRAVFKLEDGKVVDKQWVETTMADVIEKTVRPGGTAPAPKPESEEELY